jgi:hypothetical protein
MRSMHMRDGRDDAMLVCVYDTFFLHGSGPREPRWDGRRGFVRVEGGRSSSGGGVGGRRRRGEHGQRGGSPSFVVVNGHVDKSGAYLERSHHRRGCARQARHHPPINRVESDPSAVEGLGLDVGVVMRIDNAEDGWKGARESCRMCRGRRGRGANRATHSV